MLQKILEELESGYEDKILEVLNKAIKDELAAAISYIAMSEKVYGQGNSKLRDELAEHGKEEYEHFTEIISFAAKHGLIDKLQLEVDMNVIKNAPSDPKKIIDFSQNLELQAIEDYRKASAYAKDNGDFETHEFFAELAGDEEEHYDEIAVYTGKSRPFKSY
jgi:bacterioferritin (cytochrome b1)